LKVRSSSEIVFVAGEDDFVVLGLADETEWAGADGMAREIGRGVQGDDACGGWNQIPEKGCVGFFQMETYRKRGNGVDFIDHAEATAFWRFVGGVEDEVESGFYVGGSERVAVLEMDAGFQMENVSERIGSLPGFGQVAVEVPLRVAGEESAEDQAVEALGLAVGGEAWVQTSGAGRRIFFPG